MRKRSSASTNLIVRDEGGERLHQSTGVLSNHRSRPRYSSGVGGGRVRARHVFVGSLTKRASTEEACVKPSEFESFEERSEKLTAPTQGERGRGERRKPTGTLCRRKKPRENCESRHAAREVFGSLQRSRLARYILGLSYLQQLLRYSKHHVRLKIR